MTGFTVDASEVRAFATEMAGAPALAERQVRGVLAKGALNIRNEMRTEAAKSTHFGQIAPTISYDLNTTSAFGGGVFEAEIGPNKHFRAARIANIAYFGGSNGGGGTVADPQKALENEAPKFVSALEKLLGDLL